MNEYLNKCLLTWTYKAEETDLSLYKSALWYGLAQGWKNCDTMYDWYMLTPRKLVLSSLNPLNDQY